MILEKEIITENRANPYTHKVVCFFRTDLQFLLENLHLIKWKRKKDSQFATPLAFAASIVIFIYLSIVMYFIQTVHDLYALQQQLNKTTTNYIFKKSEFMFASISFQFNKNCSTILAWSFPFFSA